MPLFKNVKKKFDKNSRNCKVRRMRNPPQIKAKHKSTKIKEEINRKLSSPQTYFCEILKRNGDNNCENNIKDFRYHNSGSICICMQVSAISRITMKSNHDKNLKSYPPKILRRIEAKLPNLVQNKLCCIQESQLLAKPIFHYLF